MKSNSNMNRNKTTKLQNIHTYLTVQKELNIV